MISSQLAEDTAVERSLNKAMKPEIIRHHLLSSLAESRGAFSIPLRIFAREKVPSSQYHSEAYHASKDEPSKRVAV